MAASDARPVPQKNVAYRVTFPLLDADGDCVTGATGLDSEVSKDGGTFADCTSDATEIATASGIYYLDLTSDEMNADTVAIQVKTTSSGAKTTVIVLYPEEAGDIRVEVSPGGIDAIVDGIYVEAFAGQNAAGSFGELLNGLKSSVDSIAGGSLTDPIVDAVWNELAADHTTAGTFGLNLDVPVSSVSGGGGITVDQIWDAATSGMTEAGSIGKRLADDIDATISSRMATYTQPTGFLAATFPTDPADQSLVIAATDAVMTRLGTPAGASIAADIAVIESQTDDIGVAGAGLTALATQTSVNDVPTNAELATALLTVTMTGVDAATANKLADHARRRTQANVEASSDGDALSLSSEYGAIQQAQEANYTTGVVKKTDGTTTLGTLTIATSAGVDPIRGVS